MKKFPKSIQVAGKKIKVIFTDEPPEPGYDGVFYPDEKTIAIHKGSDVGQTLFHEIVHAAFEISGIIHMLNPEIEHAIIGCLENSVYGLYKLDI